MLINKINFFLINLKNVIIILKTYLYPLKLNYDSILGGQMFNLPLFYDYIIIFDRLIK